jgi:hypothetical protein
MISKLIGLLIYESKASPGGIVGAELGLITIGVSFLASARWMWKLMKWGS